MKMWSGRFREPLDPEFEQWQRSFPYDRRLLPFELQASAAHANALERAGVLSKDELEKIQTGLSEIEVEDGDHVGACLKRPHGRAPLRLSLGTGLVQAALGGVADVHPGALAHRLEALEDGDLLGPVISPGFRAFPGSSLLCRHAFYPPFVIRVRLARNGGEKEGVS